MYVKQLHATYVVLFYCFFSLSVRRVRYARSINKVHSRLHQRPPDLCVAVSYNHQAAIHHRSLCWVTWSPVCFPCVSFLLRPIFFVLCRHLFQHVKFDILVATAFSSVSKVRFDEFYFFHKSSGGNGHLCFLTICSCDVQSVQCKFRVTLSALTADRNFRSRALLCVCVKHDVIYALITIIN